MTKVSTAFLAALGLALVTSSRLPCPGQTSPTPPARVQELKYFLGAWDCVGKFTRSGAAIEAHLEFEAILGQSFILFRHDDKPPHNYHAGQSGDGIRPASNSPQPFRTQPAARGFFIR